MSHHLNCIRHISSQSQSHAFRISETAISLPLRNTDHAALSTDPASRYTNRSASRPCPASPAPSNPQRTCTCMHSVRTGRDLISSRFPVPPLPGPARPFNFISRHTLFAGPHFGCSRLHSETNSERGLFAYPFVSRVTRQRSPVNQLNSNLALAMCFYLG
jgi:hypothetical protein